MERLYERFVQWGMAVTLGLYMLALLMALVLTAPRYEREADCWTPELGYFNGECN